MINIQDKKDCCGCNACVQRCPKQCISMHEDSEGFLYPEVDDGLCIDCGLCEKVCPVVNQGEVREPLAVYAAKNPNEEIRMQSSSGGIFTMLAERTIANGGVVFGAAFNESWEVEHKYAETSEGLAAFRGSKYVQSRIGETFLQAESFLKQGREVLFSGTPCQIAGLRKFLRRDYANLIAVDFICHGVPSPGVFRTYLEEEKERFCAQSANKNSVSSYSNHSVSGRDSLSSANKAQIEAISFRDKKLGWKKYSFVLVLSKTLVAGEKNTVSFSSTLHENPFLRGFLADLYLRPSCHTCPAKELKSGSDITIGDYWGIAQTMPELDDDKGVSVIIANTVKGCESILTFNTELHKVEYEDIRVKNPAICHSSLISKRREDFFKETEGTFTKKVVQLSKTPLNKRIKNSIINTLRTTLIRLGLFKMIKRIL